MNKRVPLLILLLLLLGGYIKGEGFYKDIFIDAGISLAASDNIPAVRRLGLSMESFIWTPLRLGIPRPNWQDSVLQKETYIGSKIDHNGHLLYPDGQPRFKVIYVRGGYSYRHGSSLTEAGRENFRKFYRNGGSYVGTCGGMFLTSMGKITHKHFPSFAYLHIWPGTTQGTGLFKSSTGQFIEPGSALLNYYNFGGDMYIANVRHNGGALVYEPHGIPEGTEVLLRYDYEEETKLGRDIHKKISTLAYKESEQSGRLVVTGSHPEAVTSGERLDLFCAMIQYAMDGVGEPVIKDELFNGERRIMDKSTLDNDPDYTKIGDKQYHHFTVNIPEGAKNFTVELAGADVYDLNLYMSQKGPAFISVASLLNISKGANKSICEKSIEGGLWYISVECDTTVEVAETQWGVAYVGNLSVLNGVPYSLIAKWE